MARGTRIFAIVLTSLLAIGAGEAAAKKGKAKKPGPVVTRSADASGSGLGTIVTATARCPGRTKAVGGGFSETPFNQPGGYAGLVFESVKVGQKAWRASTQLIDSGPPDVIELTAFVYCRKGARATGTVAASAPTAPGLVDGPAVTARCGGKRRAMSGGASLNPPIGATSASAILTGSLATGPRTWQSQVLSGLTGTNTLTSFAYCTQGKAPALVSNTGAIPAQLVPTTTTVSCTGKKRMIAGGFSHTPQPAPPAGYILVHESARAGNKSWSVSGTMVGPAVVAPIATGLCAP